MTERRCHPSWLQLERYALDELPADEAAEVARAIEASEVARARLRAIETDEVILRPLVTLFTTNSRRWWAFGAVAAPAVALALGYVLARPPDGSGVKGGDEPVIQLGVMHEGRARLEPDMTYRGDAISVWVTCTPPRPLDYRVEVTSADGMTSAPLAGRIECGNLRRLPGAFAIDAVGPATICVVDASMKDRRICRRARIDGGGSGLK